MRKPSRMSCWLISLSSVLSLCLICSTLLSAQSTGGRILGRVSDSSGAVLAGVKVTATNEATGVSRDTQTNDSGEYGFPQVPVGTYTISFDLTGFKTNERKGIMVDLNQVITLNSVLQIGETKETVEVTSEAPIVDTTSTQLGAVMDARQVSNLPLNSRDTYQLLQLQPGVQGVGGSDLFYGSNTAGAVSVNGGRGRSNNFSVNGGDGNDLFVNGPAIQPSPDSIEEFRVLSNTFDAEYGRNSGAVINVVTKSGTNQLHGSFYEFFRNDVLDSKGFLDPATPDNKQNQFGATFGGPIKKDRTFIFASYDGRRVVQGIVGDPTVVPTAAERNGDFSQSPFTTIINPPPQPPTVPTLSSDALAGILQNRPAGNGNPLSCAAAIASAGGVMPTVGTPWTSIFPNSQIPTSCFDPVAFNLMKQYVPCPNADPTCTNLSNTSNIFQSIPHAQQRENQFTVKLDHHINDRQNLSVYYYFNDAYDAEPFTKFQAESTNLLPGFGDLNKTRSQQVNISHTWTLSTTVVNEARITYFREGQGTFLSPQNHHLVQDSCNPPLSIVVNGVKESICFTGTTDTPNIITSDPKIGITPGPALGAQHEGVPDIDVSGGFTIGNDFEGELPQIGNTYQFSDNLTKVKGNHTMKFGVDFRIQRFLQTLYFAPQGDYAYSGGGLSDFISVRNSDGSSNLFPNYLMGIPDTDLIGSTNSEDVRGNALYLFAQDSWKVKPNITLNYGLRWEYNQPFYDAGGRYQTFRPGQATTTYPCQLTDPNQIALYGSNDCSPTGPANAVFPLGLVVPGDAGVPKGLTKSYYKSFAPRIGIAWDPGKNGKMTIRGGFGLFYNPIEQLVLEQFQAEPPFGGSTTITEGFFNTPFVLQNCTLPCGTVASGGTGQGVLPNPFGSILNPAHGTSIDWSAFRPIVLFGELQPNLRAQYTEQYNLGIEREVFKDTVLTVGYVGSQGHRLLATHDLSPANAQTCLDLQNISNLTGDPNLACGPFFGDSGFNIAANEIPAGVTLHLPYGPTPVVTGPNPTPITLVGLRPYSSPSCNPITGSGCPLDGIPVFSSIYAQDTIANSAYNSLQASLERRFSNGLQFEIAYTFSKSIDDASSFENALKPICNGVLNNFSCNRSLSLFDAKHRLVISYLWQIPVPKYSGAKGQLLDGWAVSGITSFQSGFPIRMQTLDDQELENDTSGFEAPGRPVETGPVHFLNPRNNNNYYFCNPASGVCPIQDPPLGSLGGPRTICCGPGINNFDMSLQKGIPIGETVHAEFRAEFFNIFNHSQFLNPDGNLSDGPDFGRVTHTREPRQIQFALKFSF
ncbi:MAG TPA: carboxypeptidase regulatory-like domain-containing protein [Terriglobales bacterium]|nr:carboxypeptidase regulatory-like domain-containing protein [Terriglobales bacterium]